MIVWGWRQAVEADGTPSAAIRPVVCDGNLVCTSVAYRREFVDFSREVVDQYETRGQLTDSELPNSV
jgi:hypothetical protein